MAADDACLVHSRPAVSSPSHASRTRSSRFMLGHHRGLVDPGSSPVVPNVQRSGAPEDDVGCPGTAVGTWPWVKGARSGLSRRHRRRRRGATGVSGHSVHAATVMIVLCLEMGFLVGKVPWRHLMDIPSSSAAGPMRRPVTGRFQARWTVAVGTIPSRQRGCLPQRAIVLRGTPDSHPHGRVAGWPAEEASRSRGRNGRRAPVDSVPAPHDRLGSTGQGAKGHEATRARPTAVCEDERAGRRDELHAHYGGLPYPCVTDKRGGRLRGVRGHAARCAASPGRQGISMACEAQWTPAGDASSRQAGRQARVVSPCRPMHRPPWPRHGSVNVYSVRGSARERPGPRGRVQREVFGHMLCEHENEDAYGTPLPLQGPSVSSLLIEPAPPLPRSSRHLPPLPVLAHPPSPLCSWRWVHETGRDRGRGRGGSKGRARHAPPTFARRTQAVAEVGRGHVVQRRRLHGHVLAEYGVHLSTTTCTEHGARCT
ncbi:hypothetical protein DCS_02739 [Drechmeria coniospora]|uniref:Uncharacterized protein n=1 Tax=Drechmeria coniospora TaxID=98403 RepID=A0A151GWW5_DRECN|nr:hypothetical protein DCS_02739 [Drechmeria coniospora]KYK61596.1 hypothetical protein DCS_02739 [Drechmeria coniospora]